MEEDININKNEHYANVTTFVLTDKLKNVLLTSSFYFKQTPKNKLIKMVKKKKKGENKKAHHKTGGHNF